MRRDLLLVHREHLLFQVLPHLVVERMRDVLEGAVLALLARHRHEQALGTVDDLDVRDDEALIKHDRYEGLQLLVVHRDDLDVRDFHDGRSFPGPSRELSPPIRATGPSACGTGRRSACGCGTPGNRLPAGRSAPGAPAGSRGRVRSTMTRCRRATSARHPPGPEYPGYDSPGRPGLALPPWRPARARWKG